MKWRVWIFWSLDHLVLSSSYYPRPSQSRPIFYWTRQPQKGCNKRRNLEPWTPFLRLTFFGWCSLLPMFFSTAFCFCVYTYVLISIDALLCCSWRINIKEATRRSLTKAMSCLWVLCHAFSPCPYFWLVAVYLRFFNLLQSKTCLQKKHVLFKFTKKKTLLYNTCCEPKLVCNLSGNKKFKQKCLNQIYTRSFYRHLILSSWWILGLSAVHFKGHIFCSVSVHATVSIGLSTIQLFANLSFVCKELRSKTITSPLQFDEKVCALGRLLGFNSLHTWRP